MQKVELLAPAGDQESLIAAIANGADAIYLGGTMFNARAYAKNFDHDQLKWAVEYAHLRGVRIFVTVNTLFKDEEFDELIDYLKYLYDIQVDALIIQDIGLFKVVREVFPDFEIHISTQASIMNKYGAKFFEELGAKRIVLARENSIEEIKNICQSTSLDVEVFVHGALCVSYSGQCLMSSFIGKRSGNRGQCAQPCRLNYRLMKDDQLLDDKVPYLLSPKDLMTIEHIDELIEAGVYSFKIEGRMKRPEYVASVVKAYKNAIQAYFNHCKIDLNPLIHDMKAMFNRNYTSGYIFNDMHLLEGDYPGNKGIVIGNVSGYSKKNKRVIIDLTHEIKQEDSIVFESIDKGRPVNKIYLNNKLVNSAQAKQRIEIEFDYPVYNGNVRKTIDINVIKNMQQTYQKDIKKLPIHMYFEARLNHKALIKVKYNDYEIIKYSDFIVEKAINKSIDKNRIEQQLSKLGQTSFYIDKINVMIDPDISLSIKELNQLRRDVIDELTLYIKNKKIHSLYNNVSFNYNKIKSDKHEKHVLVSSINQLNAILNHNIDYIYYPYQNDALEAFKLCRINNIKMILFIPRINKTNELEHIKSSQVYKLVDKVVCNDYGSYYLFNDKKRIIGTGLNIYNTHSANYYHENKILSLEMSKKNINQLETDFNQLIMQVYGKIENMISEYCPISQFYFGYQKKNCNLCKNAKYSLIDRKNEKFDLFMDEKCRMHLLNSKAIYIDKINQINTKGLFFHFTNETPTEINEILHDFDLCINNEERITNKNNKNWTFGYFKN